MDVMKAVVYDRPEKFEIRDVPVPRPGPTDVLLKVVAAGVCGTDLHLHAGEFGPAYPLTPGHEIVGEVAELGSGVHGLRLGQRVTVDNTTACGSCIECRRARVAFCRNVVAQGVNAPGGFAEFVVAAAAKCFPVDDLPADVAVFTEPTACVVHGLDLLELPPGAQVLIFGAGPTGLIMTQLLARSGASDVTVAAPTKAKLELAATSGADHTVQVDRSDIGAARDGLRELAPDGFDVVVDATGALSVLEHASDLTRTGGTIFVYGMAAENDRWPVSPYDIFRRELTLKGSFAQQYSFDRALRLLRGRRVDTSGLITHRFAIEDYEHALAAIADSACVKAVIVPS
jgi:D-arabinitol dehydrogenase (NADP+)